MTITGDTTTEEVTNPTVPATVPGGARSVFADQENGSSATYQVVLVVTNSGDVLWYGYDETTGTLRPGSGTVVGEPSGHGTIDFTAANSTGDYVAYEYTDGAWADNGTGKLVLDLRND